MNHNHPSLFEGQRSLVSAKLRTAWFRLTQNWTPRHVPRNLGKNVSSNEGTDSNWWMAEGIHDLQCLDSKKQRATFFKLVLGKRLGSNNSQHELHPRPGVRPAAPEKFRDLAIRDPGHLPPQQEPRGLGPGGWSGGWRWPKKRSGTKWCVRWSRYLSDLI